jgi:hypothetical protein
LVRRFAEKFWKSDWPGSARPSAFYDPRALELEGPGGVLHAKAVVADDEAVFITSANLAEARLGPKYRAWCSDSRPDVCPGRRWLFPELDRSHSTKAFAFGMTENAPALKDSPMYILRAFAFLLFLAQGILAEQPTPILPDPKLTPGDTFDVTAQDVCVPGYAKKVRAVPAWLKRQAYAEYGITHYKTGDYEVDHLIPLSLGGSNSIRNLWPQSTKTSPWNSYVKDALERKLHKLVCAGQFDLKTAQSEIASNWIEAYQKYVGKNPPTPRFRETKPAPAASTASQVWVNTRSGKYWKPGSRFYGKTKEGEFTSELDALDRGYSPAGGTGHRLCEETRN